MEWISSSWRPLQELMCQYICFLFVQFFLEPEPERRLICSKFPLALAFFTCSSLAPWARSGGGVGGGVKEWVSELSSLQGPLTMVPTLLGLTEELHLCRHSAKGPGFQHFCSHYRVVSVK